MWGAQPWHSLPPEGAASRARLTASLWLRRVLLKPLDGLGMELLLMQLQRTLVGAAACLLSPGSIDK